jgi:hypothetical protein
MQSSNHNTIVQGSKSYSLKKTPYHRNLKNGVVCLLTSTCRLTNYPEKKWPKLAFLKKNVNIYVYYTKGNCHCSTLGLLFCHTSYCIENRKAENG